MRSPSEVGPAQTPRVLAYDPPETNAETLRSLRRQTHTNFRLLLVDNASGLCSFEGLAREFPGLSVRRPRLPRGTHRRSQAPTRRPVNINSFTSTLIEGRAHIRRVGGA
ncbi:MAG TPA: hypothetical protein VF521_04725 [Pyrinomonadaceae bacterium]